MTPREKRKIETMQIIIWWHKPFVPPQSLTEIWQRQQIVFFRGEALYVCSGVLIFTAGHLPDTHPISFILEMPENGFGNQNDATVMQIYSRVLHSSCICSKKASLGKMCQHSGVGMPP